MPKAIWRLAYRLSLAHVSVFFLLLTFDSSLHNGRTTLPYFYITSFFASYTCSFEGKSKGNIFLMSLHLYFIHQVDEHE